MKKDQDYQFQSAQEPVDPEKKAKRPWQAWLSGSPVLFISILLHILFAIIATLFIVQRIQEKRKQNFTEVAVSPSSPAAAAAKHQSQVTEKKNAMSTPDIVHSITVENLSQVTLPQVSLPADSSPSGAGKLDGTAVTGSGIGTGTGMGATGSMHLDASAIAATVFGMPNAKGLGLKGIFYDLKQKKNGDDSQMNIDRYSEVIYEFMHTGWRESYFNQYYKASKPLYLPQLFIPYILADDGPKAFNVEDEVKPSQWVVLYTGKFQVAHDGEYRLVGYGDDIDEVAINNRTVLDASLDDAFKVHDPKTTLFYDYTIPVDSTVENGPGGEFSGGKATKHFRVGSWVQLRADDVYKIKILIGERPGGYFCSFVMVEEKGVTYDKTPEGSPILPFFKIANVKMPDTTINCPPTDKNTDLGWKMVDDDDTGDDSSATSSQ